MHTCVTTIYVFQACAVYSSLLLLIFKELRVHWCFMCMNHLSWCLLQQTTTTLVNRTSSPNQLLTWPCEHCLLRKPTVYPLYPVPPWDSYCPHGRTASSTATVELYAAFSAVVLNIPSRGSAVLRSYSTPLAIAPVTTFSTSLDEIPQLADNLTHLVDALELAPRILPHPSISPAPPHIYSHDRRPVYLDPTIIACTISDLELRHTSAASPAPSSESSWTGTV